MSLQFLLKASRPGLWFQTVWLYVLPTAGTDMLDKPLWWLGLFYVTWPLNLLVYGWNDIVDVDTDAINPRKDSWLFGARGTPEELETLPKWIMASQAPFVAAFAYLLGWPALFFFGGMFLANGLYNLRIGGLRGLPPFDLIVPLAYLLVVILGAELNGLAWPSLMAFGYLALFCGHAQLMGQVMDIEPDRTSGRVTTATVMGAVRAKILIMGMVAGEGLLVGLVFNDWVLGGFLLVAVPALAVDLHLYGAKQYSRRQFTMLGMAMNLAGLGSMLWVWFNGSLVTPTL